MDLCSTTIDTSHDWSIWWCCKYLLLVLSAVFCHRLAPNYSYLVLLILFIALLVKLKNKLLPTLAEIFNYALELCDHDLQWSFIKALLSQTGDRSPCITIGTSHMKFHTCPVPISKTYPLYISLKLFKDFLISWSECCFVVSSTVIVLHCHWQNLFSNVLK